MATILELAREVRHLIVNRSTGRLDVTFSDRLAAIDFSDGTIVAPRQVLFSCFEEEAIDFGFRSREVADPDEHQSGATLLIEAMESIDQEAVARVWKPYADWTVLFPQDPEIHNTIVSDHWPKGPGRLRRLMRLAVSGVVTLEPPAPKSIREEIAEIRAATERGDYWQVLGITRTATTQEIKHAYRKKARQFHPDRWHNTPDLTLKDRVEGAFRDVHVCYDRTRELAPRRLPPPIPPTVTETPVEKVVVETIHTSVKPKLPETPPESKVHQYGEVSKMPVNPEPQSLFRRIFEKVFKAA